MTREPVTFQRNALAPALIAAAALFFAPSILENDWYLAVRFVVAILTAIMAWFAVQAHQWWWAIPLVAVAVLWNPIFPFPFEGPVWIGAHIAAGAVVIIAGVQIKTPRD